MFMPSSTDPPEEGLATPPGTVGSPSFARDPPSTGSLPGIGHRHWSQARDIVHLFQCSLCSRPLKEPITLPCGRSLCRSCLPEAHDCANITYPGGVERSRRIWCPFDDCGKEHAVGDCCADVVLGKLVILLGDIITQSRQGAPPSPVEAPSAGPNAVDEDSLMALWTAVERGRLESDADEPRDKTASAPSHGSDDGGRAVLPRLRNKARGDMDCQICYGLLYDPLTTACGHTFCRSCLQRTLDHARYCPICRRELPLNPLHNPVACPTNERLDGIIGTLWADDLAERRQAFAPQQQVAPDGDYDTPLFVCTLAFPLMPIFLHVFEPRYRLLIRRALDGDRTFGMVLPRHPSQGNGSGFYELGTLLRITNVHFFADGRSLIEARGVSRFRVVEGGLLDGYAVGKTERIDDMALEEEEAEEAEEASHGSPSDGPQSAEGSGSPTAPRLWSGSPDAASLGGSLSTQALVDFALDFVARMREQSAPWLTEQMLRVYGECPTDASLLPWWLASMLPLRDMDKYRLLGTSSVRERLKICHSWTVEWESSPW